MVASGRRWEGRSAYKRPEVFIVEDEASVRRTLERALRGDFEVQCFASADEILEVPDLRHKDAVVVLDLGLTGLPAVKLLEHLRSRKAKGPRVLVFTGHYDRETVKAVMRWKPDGYLIKGSCPPIVDAVWDVLHGERPMSPEVTRVLVDIASDLACEQAEYGLSRREREVFGLIRRGATNAHVGEALGISENTVCTHLRRLYEKLGVKNAPEPRTAAIEKAGRLGIDPDED